MNDYNLSNDLRCSGFILLILITGIPALMAIIQVQYVYSCWRYIVLKDELIKLGVLLSGIAILGGGGFLIVYTLEKPKPVPLTRMDLKRADEQLTARDNQSFVVRGVIRDLKLTEGGVHLTFANGERHIYCYDRDRLDIIKDKPNFCLGKYQEIEVREIDKAVVRVTWDGVRPVTAREAEEHRIRSRPGTNVISGVLKTVDYLDEGWLLAKFEDGKEVRLHRSDDSIQFYPGHYQDIYLDQHEICDNICPFNLAATAPAP